ncbi:MAG: M20/M25/M40 family metallo-hydrolase [Chloroflexi bacterium]|nr:M20/M25/M40 family metallo-hydrolase [Chloroflexota bacterium]MDA1240372.1 M20/M25/M40 family metallo-hydrolase [Chloroflexota bacterium]
MPTAYERALERAVPAVIEETVRICEIPAPTFRERTRANYVRDRFESIGGWDHLAIDSVSNVIAIRRGVPGAARILLCAHLDTVFPDATTPVVRSRGKLTGRGVGDNSLGVAGMLGVAEAIQAHRPSGVGDIIFAANVGEEGRGDLRGARRLVKDYARDFDAMIAIEGHALNRIQTHAVASLRYEVSVETDGGHSWGAYGRPNAIALLARAIVALEPLMPDPKGTPKTTMNVGVIRGGRSVNTIAPDAVFELDMRSVEPAYVDRLLANVRAAMRVAVGSEADVKMKRIGARPGGTVSLDAPLIKTVLAARKGLGLPEPEFYAGSTDANAALGAGFPTTCIGVTTGAEAHTPREWINTAPIKQGVPYLGRAIVAAARMPRTDLRRGRRRA